MSKDTRIAVDVAKAVFEIAISDRPGHVIRRERPKRRQFLPYLAQQAPATAVMEACGSAHYWAPRDPEARPPGDSSAAAPRPSLHSPQQNGPHRRQGQSWRPAGTTTSDPSPQRR